MSVNTNVLRAFAYFTKELCIHLLYYILYSSNSIYNKARSKRIVNKAQLGNIFWKRKLTSIHNSIPRDFLCLNSTSVGPEYVLRPNVSFYSVTDKEAI